MAITDSDSVAQDQIRAFVERIMRLREEERAIKGDIREVYAEAKGNGFDKTVLGKVVNYVEKRATDNAGQMEREALFDLYLSAFDGVVRVGTGNALPHTHEEIPPHDEDGVIIEFPATNEGGDHETSAEPEEVKLDRRQDDELKGRHANAGGENVADRPVHVSEEPGRGLTSVNAPAEGDTHSASISEPAEGNTPTSAGHGDRGAVVPSAAPVDRSKPNPWCMDPEECGVEASWDYMCLKCAAVKKGREATGAALQ